ncbi:hypothetical protein AAE478_001153 [Parahypoxylon ruwenzoriense]
MSSPSGVPIMRHEWGQWQFPSGQSSSYLLAVFVVIAILYIRKLTGDALKNLPYINPPKFYSSLGAKKNYWQSSESLIAQAREKYANQPYRFMMDIGEVVVLPPEFIDEIRNEPKFSFCEAFRRDFHDGAPGFEPLSQLSGDQLVQSVLKKHLVKVTHWHEMTINAVLLDIVSRMSSRIFIGEELCRSEDWLRVIKGYSEPLFPATAKLNICPRPFRRLMNWIIPESGMLRAQIKEAQRIIAPVIARRRAMRQAAVAIGEQVPRFDDALEWLEQEATARGMVFDAALAANFEIMMIVVALHTTIDLLQQFMIDLAQHPETMQLIHEEVLYHLRAEGLSKASLYKMQLLDSAIKETQRMKPIEAVALRRRVQGDIQLSNGLSLKEGMRTYVNTCRLRDPVVYENPDRWDGARFLKLRSQAGWENTAQLASTSRDHYAFGHGEHACPGRFFAANEIKIFLCHLLVNYEWKLSPGTNASPELFGITWASNHTAKMLIRRREKIEFDFGSV